MKINILLIADEFDDVSGFENSLNGITDAEFEFGLVKSNTVDIATDIMKNDKSDIIILDWGKQNEIRFNEMMSVIRVFPGIPVVVLTDIGDEYKVLKAIHIGVEDYLVKGQFDQKLLLRVIRQSIERKKALNEILKAGQYWQSTFDTISDRVAILDENGCILKCNASYANDLKKEIQELIGQYCYKIEHGTDCMIEDCPFIKAKKTRKRQESEMQEGERSFLITVDPVIGNDGDIKTAVHIIKDITRRKQAEDQMRESEGKYRTLMENSGIGVGVYALDGTILMFNQKALENLGGKAEDFIGKNVVEVFGSVAGRQYITRIENAIKSKGSRDYEDFVKMPSGNKWFLSNHTCILNEQGEVIGVQVIAHDITERKKTEDALKLSEERFRHVSSTMTDISYSCIKQPGRQYILNWIFGATEKITGYSTNELIAMQCWGNLVINEDKHLFNKHVLNIAPGTSDTCQLRLKHKNGSIIWIETSANCSVKEDEPGLTFLFGGLRDITERIQAEEMVKANEQKMRMVLDGLPDPIFSIDDKGKYLFVNKAFADPFGKKPEETDGLTMWDVFSKEEADYRFATLRKVIDSGQPDKFEVRVEDVKLGSRYFLTSVMPRVDAAGKTFGVYCSSKEITERKAAEEKLRESEERFRKIFEDGPLGMVMVNQDKHFIKANSAFCKMLGYTEAELCKMAFTDITHPDYLKTDVENIGKLFRGEMQVYSTEKRYIKKNNEFIWGSLTSTVIKDAKGDFLYFLSMIDDINERKIAELALHESEAKYRLLADNSADVIWTMDTEGRFTYVSPAVKKLRGFTPEEVMQQTAAESLTPVSLKVMQDALSKTLLMIAQGSKFLEPSVYELEQPCKDGSSVWTEAMVKVLFNNKGQFTGYLGITRNISERKKTELLSIEKEAAEAANRAKSEFLANISHEIRTPLNSIIGFSDLLHDNLTDSKQRLQADAIRNSGHTLLTIINDILDLSKIEAGKMNLSFEWEDLNEFIYSIRDMFYPRAKNKELEFKVECSRESDALVSIDKVRLQQVLANLVDNAIKYTETGYVSLKAELIKLSKEHAALLFTVEDTGIGIKKSEQSKIFDSFYQVKLHSIKKHEGTGLGLSITKNILDIMRGEINVKSAPRKGSVFTVKLNEVRISEKKGNKPKKEYLQPGISGPVKIKVLIADDENTNRKLLYDALEKFNYTILEAANGIQAIKLSKENKPDIILMDIRMPGIDGYEAAKILKKSRLTRMIPIIAITAATKSGNPIYKDQTLFADHLIKPVKLSKLIDMVQYQLNVTRHKIEINEMLAPASKRKYGQADIIKLSDQHRDFISACKKKYELIMKNQMINEIEEFGKDLIVFGEMHKLAALSDYGNRICTYADTFDTEHLMATLEHFPDIIKEVKFN